MINLMIEADSIDCSAFSSGAQARRLIERYRYCFLYQVGG